MASELVTADCVEAQEFPDLSRAFRVSSVPKTILNDRAELIGGLPEFDFLEAVLRAGGSPPAGTL